MTLLARNFLVSSSLAFSDLFGFTISMYIALGIMSWNVPLDIDNASYIQGWIVLHWLLGFCCVGWYSVRLRHYFYRKTFWFELKEILRTLVIFAVIEIAIVAFTEWSFSRYIWFFTWGLILLFVPVCRMATKKALDILNLWKRATWIIGNGNNAIEAYKAIKSERNLGLQVVGFISTESKDNVGTSILGVPVIVHDKNWLDKIDKNTQFIVAVESSQSDIRNTWLRNFMVKGYRYISVIPTL
ncbi:TPA: UDP-phosphate galactose phosphotransferase, partial [Klebsiella pneumoniae]|nr:UDP-phosphate galactose phosphotransferase [Klebsiella pneumoniae]